MSETVHCLHLGVREDRYRDLQIQLTTQGITDVIYFEGVVEKHNRKLGITKGFKNIIQYAKDSGLPRCTIIEDDTTFTHPNSFKYYLSQITENYDIFWAMYFVGGNDENFKINSTCSGMTLFTVHSRFYDFFLNMNPDIHIDRYLTSLHEHFVFKVCPLIPVSQSGSRSDNNMMTCDYSPLLEGREVYKGQ